jgi:hypothetical protein
MIENPNLSRQNNKFKKWVNKLIAVEASTAINYTEFIRSSSEDLG